jgi:thiosulfate dehydrogenase [quinone] large subunit
VVTGEALQGFWQRIVQIPETGRPPITYEWYRGFIQMMLDAQAYTWFAKVVAYGELLVGIALIVGAFTGIAAFFGGFMNFNFMLAGSASTNPMLFVIAVLLILAWKVSGYLGADYFLLRRLGTPWRGSTAVRTGPIPTT